MNVDLHDARLVPQVLRVTREAAMELAQGGCAGSGGGWAFGAEDGGDGFDELASGFDGFRRFGCGCATLRLGAGVGHGFHFVGIARGIS
jgi:hypothetical protein